MPQRKKFEPDFILTTRSLPEVYNKLVDLAQEFAVLGQISTTKTLISLLLRDTTSEWQRTELRYFEPFFAVADEWPEEIPECERQPGRIDENASSNQDDNNTEAKDETQVKELLEKVESLQRGYDNGNIGLALVDALCIAVRFASKTDPSMQDIANSPMVQEVLSLIAQSLHTRLTISLLTGRRELCGLLSTGALARKIPIDHDRLATAGAEVAATFTERLTSGRKAHEAESKSMKELLLELESNTKANSVGFWEQMGQPSPETLFVYPPATSEEISSLEERLGLELPSDFKEFLQITNGFGSVWNGYFVGPPLFGVDDVRWGPDYLEVAYLEFHEPLPGFSDPSLTETGEWPDSGPTLVIGSEDVHYNLLVPPRGTTAILDAYKEAFRGSDTSEDAKKQALKGIEARYGSLEKLLNLRWFALSQQDESTLPAGTFRMLLEEMREWSARGPFLPQEEKEAGSIAYSYLAIGR